MPKSSPEKGGFRSWLLKNENKPPQSVLYQKKYQDHHDRIRARKNMADNEEQSSPSYVSLVDPRPTAEDYAKYDANRRIKEKARDLRVAQRSATSSRNSVTPELEQTSPESDQYFTPKHSSREGIEELFVTPSTSNKEKNHREHSNVTPVSTKPYRRISFDQHAHYTYCLSRKMEENFIKMQNLVVSGSSLQEARQQALAETTKQVFHSGRSPRRSSGRLDEDSAVFTRSSSQPPPLETLNMLPRNAQTISPGPSSSAARETPIVQKSYVDTLVAVHQMQMKYADSVVAAVEKQMTKLESIKLLQSLAVLSPTVEETKRRASVVAVRKTMEAEETEEQTSKKLKVISELKDRIAKISDVQLSIHQLVSNQPFKGDSYNQRLSRSIDHWISLPFREFDIQTAREMKVLQRKMISTIEQFKNVASLHRKTNRSLNNSRRSIALKILPVLNPLGVQSSDVYSAISDSNTREVGTQVSSRLAGTATTQTSPRKVGIEPLDLSSLGQKNSWSQTTPTRTAVEKLSNISQPTHSPSSTIAAPSKIEDINILLESIELRNESFETVYPVSHFKTDISYPNIPSAPSEESTPRSGRVSLDSESARRLSTGVSQLLEQIKKESNTPDRSVVMAENYEDKSILFPSSDVQILNNSPVVQAFELIPKNQTSHLPDESDIDINIDDLDPNVTQFEHEKEEEEEQKQLRANASTPTPPVDMEDKDSVEVHKHLISMIDPEDEQDETKKFVNHDEFERNPDEEHFEPRTTSYDDSADDSGFLLDNKPPPRLKSIFDNTPKSSPILFQEDTPRVPHVSNDSTLGGMDMEDYCQKEFLGEIGGIMVRKAIEFQNELRGLDWISAQDVWQPPSFADLRTDFYDHFDYFDSFTAIIWGAVVDLINRNYLKFGRIMTKQEESTFEAEALEMLQREHGAESKTNEWCREVKMSKKLAGMLPIDLDYRYDIRRGLPDIEKQKYQWQQLQMVVIAERYPRKQLIEELNSVYMAEKEKLGQVVLSSESEYALNLNENHLNEHMEGNSSSVT